MTAPQIDATAIESLDFSPACGYPDSDNPECDREADVAVTTCCRTVLRCHDHFAHNLATLRDFDAHCSRAMCANCAMNAPQIDTEAWVETLADTEAWVETLADTEAWVETLAEVRHACDRRDVECVEHATNAVRTCCTTTMLCASHFGLLVRALNDLPDARCVKCNTLHVPASLCMTAVIPL